MDFVVKNMALAKGLNQSMNDIVLNFINRFTDNGKRQEVIETFSCGCCYWFAEILWGRFAFEAKKCKIIYDPVTNHWACKIRDKIYDITGDITDDIQYDWEDWHDFEYKDPLLTKRLYHDCINF